MPKFEFLIPGSPTPSFFSQIALFRHALDCLGGDYRAARVMAVFGDTTVGQITEPWKSALERVETHWVSPEAFEADGFLATGNKRFELISDDADLSVICDADTLMMRPFGPELLDHLGTEFVAGVIAHYHFPFADRSTPPIEDWKRFSQALLGCDIEAEYPYVLAEKDVAEAPFYVNFGFVAGTPSTLKSVAAAMTSMMPKISEMLESYSYFSAQIAFALAVEATKTRHVALPIRYNFPNDPKAERIYPKDMQSIVLMHYLRHTVFNRQEVFTSPQAYQTFLSCAMDGSNALFRDYVTQISGYIAPVPALLTKQAQ